MDFTYLSQPPRRYTFEQPRLKEWTESWCSGKVLNLFAGKTLLSVDEVRVDIDEECPADHHMDAECFVEMAIDANVMFDTIVFDPPYNLRKSREKYGGRYIGKLTKIKNLLSSIMPVGGKVISFGYDSVGMAAKRGFKKTAICLVCHGGDHNDTICVVDRYYGSIIGLDFNGT